MLELRCRSRLALPIYGPKPSPMVCEQCEFRDGPRGLGDYVALAISYTPFRRLQAAGCGGCKERQEALNSAVPLRPCGCAKPAAQADEPNGTTP